MSRGRRITVLVADDHVVMRAALVAMLRGEPDLDVVAEVADGEEAFERIEAGRPDVALLDIAMPRMTGIEVARKLRDSGLETASVILSQHVEPAFFRAALEAGASGYVLKSSDPGELPEAIRVAASGDVYLTPKVAASVVAALRAGPGPDPPAALTPRERDVLRLLARGLASKEIAAELGIGLRTVDTHRADIARKLGIRHVPGLVKYAIRNHLATLEE